MEKEHENIKLYNIKRKKYKLYMAKKLVKLTEGDLHNIIKESVNKVLKENSIDIDNDSYFGGGLPDRYFDDDDYVPDNDRISKKEINQLETIADTIMDLANKTSGDTSLLYNAVDCIEKFISHYNM